MYDDAVRAGVYNMSSAGIHHQGHHWYDEPPYESDPDDFLMSGINCGPAATIQVSGFFVVYIDFIDGPGSTSFTLLNITVTIVGKKSSYINYM